MTDIDRARKTDLSEVLALLRDAELPSAGVEQHFDNFLVARDDGELVGCVGLERHGAAGLLRSLAVRSSERGAGVGRELVERVLAEARARDLGAVYLLTTTASAYFPRFGFETIDRAEVDPTLETSEELRGACPETAICMRLRL